ncbi:MAG: S-layer homology domain-containing protein [Oscillospiraceae bacterium]
MSVTVTLSDEMAKQYKFANGTTTDTFTIAGTINKAFPDVKLNLLKTEFMTGEKLCDTLTISGVMEEAAVTYRYAVFPGAVSEDYDEFNTPITEDTVINEAGSYWVYATTAETANYKPEFTPSVKITVLCTVTFDANGGTLASADSTKAVGYGVEVTYGELPTPTRPDYRFDGWFTEKDGGDPVDADTLVMQATDHTLYAHWTANQKMIHVDETSLHTKSYDGMTGVDLNRLAGDLIFRDESGNDVTQDVQGKFTVTEASFNAPGFFQAYCITGKIAIKDEYASELQLNKESFTIDGKIEKAKPVLTGLEFKPKKQLYAGDSFGWNFDNNNLSGGTATITAYNGGTVTVPGTFSFDEGELRRGSPLKGGENRLPVRFDPKDVANVEEAACEVVVNVPYRNYDCVSASYLYPAYGTAFKDLDLPDSVTVNARYDASDGGVGFNYYADITWDASKYDPTNLDEQIMYGTFDRSYWEDYIAFPEGADVRVKLVIKVQPPVQAETEITELPTFQWTKRLDNGSTFKLPVNTIFLFTKFKVGTYSGQTGALTGGKARIKGTDTELSGTFALEFPYGQTETFYSEAGTKEVTVVFKPENSLFYAEARATLSVEAIKLTLAKMYNTVSITDKDVGTQFANLGLPTSVGFETEDGTVKFISVEWNAEGYDRNSSAEQTITGTLKYDSLDERELNPTTLTATATVKLIPPAHVHAYTQKVQKAETLKTPASCTEDAVYYLSCECGEISPNEADVFIAENTALDHDFGDWTSNGDGKHTRTCKRYNCTASETDSCSGGTATCVEKAVCKACKAVYGELGAHVFSDEWTIGRYQHWHVCTVCRAKETERLNHFDQDDDHLCDTCGYQITDHTFGTDWSMDETSHWHACSMCGAKSDEAVHTDANKDHACDVCGKTISNHVDTDKDHVCDYCEKTISNHEDTDKDHVCDYCEKTISNHVDANKDHVCDYCEKTISNHEDTNKDHVCDYCEKTISNHVDANNDHRCDFCERLITNHADENRDHICDICEKVISNHTGGEATCTAKAVCELCGKAYGEKDPANHTGENRWTADDKTHEREWTCCGVVTVETEAHTFGKWVTTVKPTAHKKGEKERTCEVCGYTQTKTVSPTGVSGTTDSGKKPTTGTDDRLPFDDVRRGDWFYDDVRYVYETGLMNGTANRIFAPSVSTTRAMIVTILWRLEGSPVVNFAMRFRDVVENAWYSEAVRWAAANGIVTGYSENAFGPNDNITREQLAAILHRYAKYKGLDVSAGEDTNILSFDDAQTISGYAVPAMQWACGAGLMQGSNRKLLPTAQATRAQVAAMLHRCLG